jgi:hypothetical protein
MRTAIFTARETTLTIKASEVLDLVQMGREGAIIRMSPGVTSVTVGAGVFKVVSKAPVSVTAPTAEVKILATLSNKGDWPDRGELRAMLPSDGNDRAVMSFLAEAKSVAIE